MLPRLYLTGAFYFILMYTGSNVVPIASFGTNSAYARLVEKVVLLQIPQGDSHAASA